MIESKHIISSLRAAMGELLCTGLDFKANRGRRARLFAVQASRPLLWGFAICLASLAQAEALEDAGQQTRFQRTVRYLQEASPELRGEFAATALSQLASAYFAEAELARNEARQAGQYSQLWAWSVTVDRYASQMPLLLEDIELGLPVHLTLGGEKSLAITVADRTVILSPPRLTEQSAFEQRILMAFCAGHSCEQFAPGDEAAEPIPVSTAQIRPNWTFTAQESVCAYHGIAVRFKSSRNMTHSRLICEQFLQEVMTLADELGWQQRHAVTIEWDHLAIQPTPHRPEHMVRLNAMGDSVLVTIPVIYGSPGLLAQILPWIHQRVSDQREMTVAIDAEHYGWQKP